MIPKKGPLDESLPNSRYMSPSFLWRMACNVPLVVAILIVFFLLSEHLRALRNWLGF